MMIDPTGKAGVNPPPRVNAAPVKPSPTVLVAAVAAQADGRRTGQTEERAQSVLAAIVAQGPPLDSAKVAAIKAAMAAGVYRIDADRLARDIAAHGGAGTAEDSKG
jgi:flagellar biosynthesis anti-sigma factor FlgM